MAPTEPPIAGNCVMESLMSKIRALLIGLLTASTALDAVPAVAAEGIRSEQLVRQPTDYPSSDKAGEVSVVRLTLAPGARTGRHAHPFPPAGYVLEGRLDVAIDGGEVRHFKAGDAFLETKTVHEGSNPGSTPTTLLVFYIGAKGTPLSLPR